ncbi:MAG TPA: ABC transporter permease subunit, partial [Streptosporangiaceae bacterium]|nr:ABC transporter permease subunit [Streptosporangiaceae bacterium]
MSHAAKTADAPSARAAGGAVIRSARAARWARGLAGVVVFLLIAEALGRLGVIPQSVLPLTSSVLAKAVSLLGSGRFLADLAATVEAWAVGLLITVIIGVPLGVLLGSLPGVRVATRAVVEFLRPIPSVALILLVSLLLGPGLRMSVTLIVYGAIWPVLYNTIAGLDDVDPVAEETHRAFGFSRLATIRMVSLPSAAPFIATGIRLASAVAIILDIAAGYITGRINGPGIGAFIAQASTGASNTTVILAATIWAGILGLVL